MYLRVTHGHIDPANADAALGTIPDLLAALRQLPGCQDVQTGLDRDTGETVSVMRFDTLDHATFARESIGEPFERLLAAGWQPEAPLITELMQ